MMHLWINVLCTASSEIAVHCYLELCATWGCWFDIAVGVLRPDTAQPVYLLAITIMWMVGFMLMLGSVGDYGDK